MQFPAGAVRDAMLGSVSNVFIKSRGWRLADRYAPEVLVAERDRSEPPPGVLEDVRRPPAQRG
jgi:hypothetical protein